MKLFLFCILFFINNQSSSCQTTVNDNITNTSDYVTSTSTSLITTTINSYGCNLKNNLNKHIYQVN